MQGQVILFDGVCNLCNASVQFIIRRDKDVIFHFAAIQSDFSKKLLRKHGLETDSFNSILLFEDGLLFNKSTAVLKIVKKLNGIWPVPAL